MLIPLCLHDLFQSNQILQSLFPGLLQLIFVRCRVDHPEGSPPGFCCGRGQDLILLQCNTNIGPLPELLILDRVLVILNIARLKSEKRMIFAHADILAGIEMCAALTVNDVARNNGLA